MEPPPEIVGRESEIAQLERFLDDDESGPSAFLLEGDIGIGKTVLWKGALVSAERRQRRVLSCRPGEGEIELPFAALGDLLEGVVEQAGNVLPGPQREALDVALLRTEAPERPLLARAIALAVVAVLRVLAAERPVVVAVDDVQWLDAPSADALVFAARRLTTERVAFMLARRAGTGDDFPLGLEKAFGSPRVCSLILEPLDLQAVDRLLRMRLGRQFRHPTLVELRRVSGGNPFFALELGRALLARTEPLVAGEGLPVPATLQELLRERLSALSAATREAVNVVAASTRATAETTVAAPTDRGSAMLEEAAAAGIIELAEERVRFTHPLFASVVYAAIPSAERRALHSHLAKLATDADERARHLALAAIAPAPEVAAAVESSARRARARGAPQTAAELFERAARLTPADDMARWRRTVAASECHLEAGDTDRASVLLQATVAQLPPGRERASALSRLGWVRAFDTGFAAGVEVFRRALDEVGDDLVSHVEIEQGLAWSIHETGDVAGAEPHARAALELAERLGEPRLLASALADVAFFETVRGRGIPWGLIDRALALGPEDEWRPFLSRVRPSWVKGMLLEWSGDLAAARSTLTALRKHVLAQGDEHSVSYIAFHLARVECLAGNWEAAAAHAEECLAVCEQTGQDDERPFALTVKALVDAHRGNVDEARAATDEGLPLALEFGVVPAHLEMLAVRGFLEHSVGDTAAAMRFLGGLPQAVADAGFGEPALFRYHGDLVEVLLASDAAAGRAAALTEELEEQGRKLDRVWALTIARRCRALLEAAAGDTDAARASLGEALELHRELQEPFEHGRTLLLLGSLQRRDRKKRAARETLTEALAVFDGLGARLWSTRTRAELSRIGGRTTAPDGLTPTEQRIAALAASGRTYREVAAELLISPKTVHWNVSNIYRKLGVRSRAELAAKLRRDDAAVTTDADSSGQSPAERQGSQQPLRR